MRETRLVATITICLFPLLAGGCEPASVVG
jgi:hypothetical protein